MPDKTLGDRQKDYESLSRTRLTKKLPVLIRLDGRGFSRFTSTMLKPYDERFHRCMWSAAQTLCQNIQGAKIAYVQSDEISILITDYESLESDCFFDNQVQKIVSVTAGLCSVQFYQAYLTEFPDTGHSKNLPAFDCRAWTLPKEEVANYFLFRQNDASRNSLSMMCQSHFSHKQLHGKDNTAQHELLHSIDLNWNDCPTPQKRGVCLTRELYTVPATSGNHKVLDPTTRTFSEVPDQPQIATRSRWQVDKDIPLFGTVEGRAYIERFVYPKMSPSV